MKQNWIKGDGLLLLTVLIGLVSVVGLLRWIDAHQPSADLSFEEENRYLNAPTVKRMSLGFNGLAADWYWMRSLQYVGRKIINLPENVQIDNLGQLNLKLLVPLLDATTTLDPQFMEPYQYAAVVLPEIDVQEAIRITRKGIAANPSKWKLYHHLGYIYWQQKNFKAAGEAYGEGAKLAGAPAWMEAMKARMAGEGGSRATAREIYLRMYEQAEDKQVKEMARRHLMEIASLDERDAMRRLMTAHKARTRRCPSSWREIEGVLRAFGLKLDSSGAPIDPAGTPYLLVKDKCDVKVNPESEVPHNE
ncbi:MAG: tetratricopeptide repeat protein [Pyrinomonadaceae bacterium]